MFIPFYDSNPHRYIKYCFVTWALIAVNTVVFLTTYTDPDALQSSALSFGLIPAVFNDSVDLPADFLAVPDFLTLLTYAFLHGDIWHLFGNMIFLWVFADNVEDALGHWRFLLFYCLCAIAAGYVHVLASPDSEAPVIGASGAVAGVVAGYLILYPYSKVWILALGRIPLRLRSYWVLGFWVAYQIYQIVVAEPGDIAWWTHVGGFVAGAVLVPLLRRRSVVLFGYEPDPDETEAQIVDEAASGPIGSAAPEIQPTPPRGPAE
jgi:membrane associated rhomboid family serine protease